MFRKITFLGVVLALVAICLSSYVRMTGANLACPDWPACYGQFAVTDAEEFTAEAKKSFAAHPFSLTKIGKELSYRYLLAGLAFLLLLLNVFAWWQKPYRLAAVSLSVASAVVLALQLSLTGWVISTHAMPIVVSTQALLAMMVLGLLYGLYIRTTPGLKSIPPSFLLTGLGSFAGLVLFIQLLSGYWVSSNFAVLACNGFPQCNGQWWPNADYQAAINWFHGLYTGYTGLLSYQGQVAAHWLHRIFSVLTFFSLSALMLVATSSSQPKPVRRAGLFMSLLLFAAIIVAIFNVKYGVNIGLTVAHSGISGLLMLSLIAIGFYSRYGFAEDELSTAIEAEPAVEPGYIEPEPESLYLRLKSQLHRTRSGMGGVLSTIALGQNQINDDLLEEIETNLLMADIGVDATAEIIKRLTESVQRHELNDGDALKAVLKQELLAMLRPCSKPLKIPEMDGPFVILVVGINGAGKTTSIGKLAKRLQSQGHSVMLAAGDTFRAAAVEQLQTWGERNNIHVVAQHTGADSASVIFDGVQSAQAKGVDVLIADTAGRLHTKSNLMDELKKVKRIMAKLDETAPHEVLLVLDAGTGQNALSQAKQFNETVELTGLALTKLDGTAKGGVIFALAKQMGLPIRFIGIGEGIDDLQDFDAESFVDALFVTDE